jgi:hypothetical protein
VGIVVVLSICQIRVSVVDAKVLKLSQMSIFGGRILDRP